MECPSVSSAGGNIFVLLTQLTNIYIEHLSCVGSRHWEYNKHSKHLGFLGVYIQVGEVDNICISKLYNTLENDKYYRKNRLRGERRTIWIWEEDVVRDI